jgi:phytoene desaturase
MKTRKAVIIGAGFGGLALAIRLQSAGVETIIVEARDKPGGRGYYWEKDGFTFDGGPTVITDPPCLQELWALSGRDMAGDVTLLPVTPFYRLNWPDGTNFDYSNDEAGLKAEISKLNPADVAGYDKFLDYSKGVFKARLCRVSGFCLNDQGGPGAGKISGVAVCLFDCFLLCKK